MPSKKHMYYAIEVHQQEAGPYASGLRVNLPEPSPIAVTSTSIPHTSRSRIFLEVDQPLTLDQRGFLYVRGFSAELLQNHPSIWPQTDPETLSKPEIQPRRLYYAFEVHEQEAEPYLAELQARLPEPSSIDAISHQAIPHTSQSQMILKAGQPLTLDQREFLCSRGLQLAVSEGRPPSIRPQTLVKRLTKREREVLELIAIGLHNQQIADRLVISRATVHHHVQHIFNKLGVNSRPAAIAFLIGLTKSS